jgi:hypothetical protein
LFCHPSEQLADFRRCLTTGVKFLSSSAVIGGVRKGNQIVQHRIGDFDAARPQGLFGFLAHAADRRHRVEHHEGRLTGYRRQIQRRADGVQIERGRAAGD